MLLLMQASFEIRILQWPTQVCQMTAGRLVMSMKISAQTVQVGVGLLKAAYAERTAACGCSPPCFDHAVADTNVCIAGRRRGWNTARFKTMMRSRRHPPRPKLQPNLKMPPRGSQGGCGVHNNKFSRRRRAQGAVKTSGHPSCRDIQCARSFSAQHDEMRRRLPDQIHFWLSRKAPLRLSSLRPIPCQHVDECIHLHSLVTSRTVTWLHRCASRRS
eukprot:354542-Chlamydomonas_euryale.AAC.9